LGIGSPDPETSKEGAAKHATGWVVNKKWGWGGWRRPKREGARERNREKMWEQWKEGKKRQNKGNMGRRKKSSQGPNRNKTGDYQQKPVPSGGRGNQGRNLTAKEGTHKREGGQLEGQGKKKERKKKRRGSLEGGEKGYLKYGGVEERSPALGTQEKKVVTGGRGKNHRD